jgi:hypothetical protein
MSFNRTNFYNIVTVNGTQEFDYLQNNLSFFNMTYPVSYYQVTDADLMRPDMISYKNYNGSIDYWWIIMYVNDIDNPFSDLISGNILTIPNILDIINFVRNYQVRGS